MAFDLRTAEKRNKICNSNQLDFKKTIFYFCARKKKAQINAAFIFAVAKLSVKNT